MNDESWRSKGPVHPGIAFKSIGDTEPAFYALKAFEQLAQLLLSQQVADIKIAEFAEAGANFVESHFVDQLLELKRHLPRTA